MATSFIDLTGKRFGRWLVIEQAPRETPKSPYHKKHPGQTRWKCRCDCGTVKDRVQYGGLVKGGSKSCGCLRRELRQKPDNEVHSQRNPLYSTWMSMKTRCYNLKHPSSKHYGRRGIKVCQRWLDSYDDFASDIGPRPTPGHQLERRDNNGDYTPENCLWVTQPAQCMNRRSNLVHEWKGTTMNLIQVARMENVEYAELRRQVHQFGQPMADVVTLLQQQGRIFFERAAYMGATGANKTRHKRRQWVSRNNPLHGVW